MSLYFDKLYSQFESNRQSGIRKFFTEAGLVEQHIGNDPDKHRKNCIRSIRWIKQNLAGKTKRPVDWHWKPQKFRLRQVHKLRFNVLMLEDINFQLTKVLKPLIPQIADVMQTVSAQNISRKPVRPEEVLNDELCALIRDTYPLDARIYQEVSKYWHNYKEVQ